MADKTGKVSSAVVAVAVIVLVGWIQVTAIEKYPTVDEALRFWDSMSAIAALFSGAFVTYFFTRPAARKDREVAEAERKRADQSLRVLLETVGKLDAKLWEEVREDPAIQRVLQDQT